MNRTVPRWLHRHGIHPLCRKRMEKVEIGRNLSREFLVGRDPETGKPIKIETTVFGGTPVYRTMEVHR